MEKPNDKLDYEDLPLFHQATTQQADMSQVAISSIRTKMLSLDLNRVTPLDVMQLVALWQEELRNE